MNRNPPPTEEVAQTIRAALDSADLAAFSDLLDPDVQWGAPDDPTPSCRNRDQVLSWYRKGRAHGVRASVTELVVRRHKILVGLKVTGNDAAVLNGGQQDRWQVLTLAAGRIVDIRGFEKRADAVSRLEPDRNG
jgi:ketosteroid isomerase-like protein